MKRLTAFALSALVAVILTSGCSTRYRWRSSVPKSARTVAVPTFRNESTVMELGTIVARQTLREFQREGTFKIRANGDAAVEIQGVIKSAQSTASAYDRRSGLRLAGYVFRATAEVSVVDKRTHKVLIDNRPYTASASYSSGQDTTTAERDAAGRLAEDLARQIVDDVLNHNWLGDANK